MLLIALVVVACLIVLYLVGDKIVALWQYLWQWFGALGG